jgi:AmmeMemoRadiSam system protein B
MVVPHAGYQYSGPIAAHAYLKLAQDGFPETFIILCPNHTGLGSGVSIMTSGEWETPLGNVEVDSSLSKEIMKQAPIIDEESMAHQGEHSIEVQLPFIQSLNQNFQIVPIAMLMQDLQTSTEVGQALMTAIENEGRDVVVMASTDLTHYKPQEMAETGDKMVISALQEMDENKMLGLVEKYNVTMCGYGPLTATTVASRRMGATQAQILKYATSGDTSGDLSSVVGYVSAILK